MTRTILIHLAFIAPCIGFVAFIGISAVLIWADNQTHTHLRHDREEQS